MSLTITVEQVLPAARVADFYALYRAAFGPLLRAAAARHMLSAEEFAEEMADPRIIKHVAWSDGEPVALTTVTTDLDAVAWISPEFYAARYPQYAARKAIFYLGYTLIRPEYQNSGLYQRFNIRIGAQAKRADGILAMDVCGFNAARRLPEGVAAMARQFGGALTQVDTQSYYVVAPV
ncbi:hypothetical protein GCM10010124_01540 [Pilimelia terevasa]|uniref:Uncharacterized protein n=1 Tax=Pilimelia terevasa TaxID=53372 RepID=A0A8J3BGK3_9ACTN|nr:hypothetical protein [Pilimelia terevasa]GGK12711.1 hypothetical protein GCM10010124_01540 [Pilimelia terevasa]